MAAVMSVLPSEFGEERGTDPTDDNRDVFGDPEWQAWARSSFASSSGGSRFFDADSEVGSFKSAASSNNSEGSTDAGLGNKIFLNKQLLEWKERFEEEQSKRHKAEQQVSEKDKQLQIARKKAKDLSQKLSAEEAQVRSLQAQKKAEETQQQKDVVDHDKLIVARLVSKLFASVIARDATERKCSAEIQVLRQRLERAAVMQNMVQNLQNQDKAKQAEERQKYLHGSAIIACCGIGVLGVSLLSRYHNKRF